MAQDTPGSGYGDVPSDFTWNLAPRACAASPSYSGVSQNWCTTGQKFSWKAAAVWYTCLKGVFDVSGTTQLNMGGQASYCERLGGCVWDTCMRDMSVS